MGQEIRMMRFTGRDCIYQYGLGPKMVSTQ
jgi:hypothetical protein